MMCRNIIELVVCLLALVWFGWQAAVIMFLGLWLLNLATMRGAR